MKRNPSAKKPLGRPRKWRKDAKRTAFRMDKKAWVELQWLAKRQNVSPSEAARRAIKLVANQERLREEKGLVPHPVGDHPVTKSYLYFRDHPGR